MSQKDKIKKFDDWFIAQFGKRPTQATLQVLRAEHDQTSAANALAYKRLRETEDWEYKYQDCMKAWYAR